MKYTNSKLISCTVKSPNYSRRTHCIDRITPHCVVGQLSAERIGGCFPAGKGASCNYGIGNDGRICLVVDEKNRSWCSSNRANDQRAVTIECASETKHPYAMNAAVYEKLIDLCTDICRRYGKKKLLWFGDKKKSLNYQPAADEMVLTVHRWFANKACPGDWLYTRMGDLAETVTERLTGSSADSEDGKNTESDKNSAGTYRVSASNLRIRKGPGLAYPKTGYCPKGVYTITEIKKADGYTWGRLKSKVGWIALEYADKIK